MEQEGRGLRGSEDQIRPGGEIRKKQPAASFLDRFGLFVESGVRRAAQKGGPIRRLAFEVRSGELRQYRAEEEKLCREEYREARKRAEKIRASRKCHAHLAAQMWSNRYRGHRADLPAGARPLCGNCGRNSRSAVNREDLASGFFNCCPQDTRPRAGLNREEDNAAAESRRPAGRSCRR